MRAVKFARPALSRYRYSTTAAAAAAAVVQRLMLSFVLATGRGRAAAVTLAMLHESPRSKWLTGVLARQNAHRTGR